MLAVISTIAQHPLGSKVHFPNLSWAISNIESYVLIQTFKEYNLQYPNFKFRNENSHLSNTNNYFGFYNYIQGYLKEMLNIGVKAFLFTQQDIIFYKKINDIYDICVKQNKIICSFNTPYQYCMLKQDFPKERISCMEFNDWSYIQYPRIWEGCCMIPSFMIEIFINENIQFGHKPNRFKKESDLYLKFLNKIEKNKISTRGGEVKVISDYILSWEKNKGNLKKYGHDTFFEISLYCFLNNFSFYLDSNIANKWIDFHISNHAVHFHFIEKLCRETKGNFYKDFNLIFQYEDLEKSQADIAFMSLMSGVHLDSNLFFKCNFNSIKDTIHKFKFFDENYHAWMDDYQISIFEKLQKKIHFL